MVRLASFLLVRSLQVAATLSLLLTGAATFAQAEDFVLAGGGGGGAGGGSYHPGLVGQEAFIAGNGGDGGTTNVTFLQNQGGGGGGGGSNCVTASLPGRYGGTAGEVSSGGSAPAGGIGGQNDGGWAGEGFSSGTGNQAIILGGGGGGGSSVFSNDFYSAGVSIVNGGQNGGKASSSKSGYGGDGGSATMDMLSSTYNTVHLTGGSGGGSFGFSLNSITPGKAGDGGSVTVTSPGDLTVESMMTLKAGDSGRYISSIGGGGYGGNVTFNAGGDVDVGLGIIITGGTGYSGINGDPGYRGGQVTFNAGGRTVTTGMLAVTAGSNGYWGESGKVTFGAGTVNVDTSLALRTLGGELDFSVATLNFTGQNSVFQGYSVERFDTPGLFGVSNIYIGELNVTGGGLTFKNESSADPSIFSQSNITIGRMNVDASVNFDLGNDNAVINVNVSGTGKITKTGAGTLDLSGNSLGYSGSLDVSAGTIKLSTANAVGTGAITNNATLEAAFDGTLANTVAGSGDFNKTGTGRVTLANNLQQTAVNLNAGTLAMVGGKSITTATFTAADGTTVGVAAADGGNTINANIVTFADNTTLTVDLTGAASGATALTLNSGLAINSTIDVDATFTGKVDGTYTVIDTGNSTYDFAGKYNGLVNGAAATGQLGPNARYGGASYDDGTLGKLLVNISGVDQERDATWTNASSDGIWNDTSDNWDLDGSALHVFKNGDTAIFGNAGTKNVVVSPGMSVRAMTVDNSAGAGNVYTFTGDGLASSGVFTKNGEGTVNFNQNSANAFSSASLNAGRVNLSRADALGAGLVTLGNAGLGLADTLDFANNVAVTGSNAYVAVADSQSATMSGIISGAGALAKTGDGALILTGKNTHSGDIRLAAGTLKLNGNGSIASSNLSMAAGTALDISGLGRAASLKGLSMERGATIVGGGNALDMTGAGSTLHFNLTGVTAGSAALLNGGDALVVGNSTVLDILSPTDLAKGEQVVLAENLNASSTYTSGVIKTNRMKYDILLDNSYNLLATFLGVASYREESNEYFGPRGMNNINLENGTAFLDYLSDLDAASLDPAVMNALDQAYSDAFNLGGYNASLALQQMLGASVVYNSTAQSVTGGRFRQLWEKRNHARLNGTVFSGATAYLNDAGLASEDALGSVRYGARDTVPVGRASIWASGFGAWATQDSADNTPGYKYDSQGAALGFEYAVANCLQFGVSAAYSRGNLKVSDLGYKNKPDIMNLALYGIYNHESGFYAQGGLGYGHAWNDYTIDMIVGGQKKGKYGSDEWSGNLELGYVARLPQEFNLIPSVGVEYAYLDNNSCIESTSGNPNLVANSFESGHDDSVAIPLGMRFNKMFSFGCNGGYIVPEVRASWVYMANESHPSINAGYANAPGSASMHGVNPGSNFWRIGGGVSGRFNERVDYSVDYDFDTRSGFRGHNVSATVGLSF